MKCLYLFEDSPIATNYSGGAVRYWATYNGLIRLGTKVHVLRILSPSTAQLVNEFEAQHSSQTQMIRSLSHSWEDVVVKYSRMSSPTLSRFWMAVNNPVKFMFLEKFECLEDKLHDLLSRYNPDLIWANHVNMAALVTLGRPSIPWIYSHHDWTYKIHELRSLTWNQSRSPRMRLLRYMLRRAEEEIARSASVVVTGSNSEAQQLAQIGVRKVYELDTLYDNLNFIDSTDDCNVRFVHLGSLSTTSNSIGLSEFIDVVYKSSHEISQIPLLIIGQVNENDPNARILRDKAHAAGAVLAGYVSDLSTILHPYDIALIPYGFDTGYRTKIPLLFAHKQVVVTTEIAVKGKSHLIHGENCVIVPNINEFAGVLIELARDHELRRRIGNSARATFEKYYQLDNNVEKFKNIIDKIFEI